MVSEEVTLAVAVGASHSSSGLLVLGDGLCDSDSVGGGVVVEVHVSGF